jgi:hypothetical protein
MTVRSVSWIDARDIAGLLDQVASPRRNERPVAVRPMAIQGKPADKVSARIVPAKEAVAALPRTERVSARPTVASKPLVHETNNPAERLDALIAWSLAHHPCAGAFVADDNGLTLAARGISEAHVSIVGPLLSTLLGIRAIPGIDATRGALWLGAHMMSWVEARTERGGFCLGTIGEEALSTRSLEELRAALAETVRW